MTILMIAAMTLATTGQQEDLLHRLQVHPAEQGDPTAAFDMRSYCADVRYIRSETRFLIGQTRTTSMARSAPPSLAEEHIPRLLALLELIASLSPESVSDSDGVANMRRLLVTRLAQAYSRLVRAMEYEENTDQIRAGLMQVEGAILNEHARCYLNRTGAW